FYSAPTRDNVFEL
uniref:Unknown protein from 2D-PAGE of needles (Fragments) n=1 Tax=Pinus pinaster TaxID=71647 RepID=UN02_PINPS|nr:RecName: Full=Unknown protein from 2D-PAGE of needles; AltName: Full=N55 [Pinus pinaster]